MINHKKVYIRGSFLFYILLLVFSQYCSGQTTYIKHYTTKDGLPSNTIYDIYHDEDGYIWFATSKGVSRYNGIKFENFTTTDGLPDNEVFQLREDADDREKPASD